jgi:hypothetical protein
MKKLALLLFLLASNASADTIAGHTVVLDGVGKIIPWYSPAANAYDEFLDRRWNFIKTSVPPCPGSGVITNYPQYYFYDGFVTTEPIIKPDNWMNDIGEKIPNWFESARHYYAYTGDTNAMSIVRNLMDYFIAHGTSPTNFAWPKFPYTTADDGEMEVDGFQERFAAHETHVDHAGDIGLAYYGLYRFTGEAKYLTNALHVADVLATNARVGTATESVWPYRVRMDTGEIKAQYGANFIGAYALLDALIKAGHGNTNAYAAARTKARDFILQFPMQTGYWTDGHTDNPVDSTTYKSNMSKSNTALFMFDHPDFDPGWQTNIPAMIAWTETNFVYRTDGSEPAEAFGAQIVGEQDGFMIKMDYQTARHAAECARWYRHSGDVSYREKAYRCLNWVTYCSDANGRATESPYRLDVATWWSDCYGECPRMFYHAFAAMPEWAPPGEDHILYSYGVLTGVVYGVGAVQYHATEPTGTEYLRVSFLPDAVTLNGAAISNWQMRGLGGGDYAVTVTHTNAGQVRVAANTGTLPPSVSLTGPPNGAAYSSPGLITLTATATGYAGPVTNVEFFVGPTKIGEDQTAPYSFAWPNVPVGSYTFTARATDATGLSKTSAPVNVTVTAPAGSATLGNTSEGNTTDYITVGSDAWINACRFQATATQPLTAIKAKVNAITGQYQCAIYSDNAGNPSILRRATSEVTPASDGWHTFPLTSSYTVTNNTYYWLAIWSNDPNARVHADNGGTVRFGLYPYPDGWPSPVNLSGSGGFTYCIYATGPAPTVFDQWKVNYNLTGATDTSDADGDGLPLLLEYALAGDPQTADSATLWPVPGLTIPSSTRYLTLTYTKNKAATDVTIAAEVAGAVTGTWSSAAADVDQLWQVTDALTLQTITARDMTPVSAATKRFMRLKVTRP